MQYLFIQVLFTPILITQRLVIQAYCVIFPGGGLTNIITFILEDLYTTDYIHRGTFSVVII